MNLVTSSETLNPSILEKAKKSALNRWKIETLTGLLGFQALKHHQSEQQKNVEAENQRVRKYLWEYNEPEQGDDMAGSTTILGDNIVNPTPVITHQQSSGLGKVVAAAAITAGILGVPLAGIGGYLLNEHLNKKEQVVPVAPAHQQDKEDVDLGLLKLSDLVNAK